jgi:hypothetical protein
VAYYRKYLPNFTYVPCSYASFKRGFSDLVVREGGQPIQLQMLTLTGRFFKPHLVKKNPKDTDDFVFAWLQANKRDLSLYSKYAQTQPDHDSLWRDFSKYDKPTYPHDEFDELAYRFMARHFVYHCAQSQIATHEECLSNWESQSSPGYPWNTVFPDSGSFLKTMEQELPKMWDDFCAGGDAHVVWSVSPKFELRSADKLVEKKVRSFTAAPKHFTYILQKLGHDFNQKFYNANGRTWSRVGMSMFNLGWHSFITTMQRFPNHLELDGRQYDSSLDAADLEDARRFRQSCYSTSLRGRYDEVLKRAYDDIIHGLCVLPGGFSLLKNRGNPSGGAFTTVDNTQILFKKFAKVCIVIFHRKGIRLTYEDFMDNVVAGMYGDDNNVGMSDKFAQILTPQAILETSREFGLELRSEHAEFKRVEDLCFLNMNTRMCHGFYVPVPKTDKMRASMLHNVGSDVYRFVRLCGLRIVAYWNDEVMADLEPLIAAARVKVLSLAQDHKDADTGMTPQQCLSAYLTDSELLYLWLGRESKVASINPNLFKSLPIMAALFQANQEFDSTLGYPGEGPYPGASKELLTAVVANAQELAALLGSAGKRDRRCVRRSPVLNTFRGEHQVVAMRQRLLARLANKWPSVRSDAPVCSFDPTLGYPGEGPRDTVAQAFRRRKWYDPVRILGTYLGADKHERRNARDRFLDELPVVGHINRIFNPEPDEVNERPRERASHIGEALKPGPPKQPNARRRKPARASKKKFKRSIKRAIRRSQKKQSQKPRRRVRNMPRGRRMVQRIGNSISLVRAPVRSKFDQIRRSGSYSFNGTALVLDFTKIDSDVGAYASILSTNVRGFSTESLPSFFDLNPYSVSQLASSIGYDTAVVTMADFFEKWDGEFWFEWRPACSNDVNAQFTWWVDRDPTDDNEIFFGTSAISQIAEEHGAEVFQPMTVHSSRKFSFKNMWLRQAAGADVRKTSGGHAYFVTNMDILVDDTTTFPRGQLLVHYSVKYHIPTAKENTYSSQFNMTAIPVSATSSQSYICSFHDASDRAEPYSQNVVISTVAPFVPAVPPATAWISLNHGNVTPNATFLLLDFEITLTGGTGGALDSIAHTLFLNGSDVSNVCGTVVHGVITATHITQTLSILIPPGTPADGMQLQIVFFAHVTSGTAEVDGNFRFLKSTLFNGDFSGLSRLSCKNVLRHVSMSRACADDRKDDHDSDLDNLVTTALGPLPFDTRSFRSVHSGATPRHVKAKISSSLKPE